MPQCLPFPTPAILPTLAPALPTVASATITATCPARCCTRTRLVHLQTNRLTHQPLPNGGRLTLLSWGRLSVAAVNWNAVRLSPSTLMDELTTNDPSGGNSITCTEEHLCTEELVHDLPQIGKTILALLSVPSATMHAIVLKHLPCLCRPS